MRALALTSKVDSNEAVYISGVTLSDLVEVFGPPATVASANEKVAQHWRIQLANDDYFDLYVRAPSEKEEESSSVLEVVNTTVDELKSSIQSFFPTSKVTADFWEAVDHKEVRTEMLTLAKISDKERKLAQLRKRKTQLQEKKHDAMYRMSEDIHKINSEIRRVRYENKPGLKPKAKPAKNKPKKYAG